MTGIKGMLSSKGVWGGLIVVLSALLGMFGYTIGLEDQQALTDVVSQIGAMVGGLLAIYGRITASKRIGRGY